ncbi:hypothetical protein EIN_055960 [Entamoeba invadens IP1]|uniref:hypothetical protein n=1 Tax=Entamoeba invadens IP1 TaxID=370355 RepID=UPI0002C3F799|nr:hypothetical protein EIN_055960 [Entamoeba invadens IP1]ELP93241.1 hypothetical protein EIN_055960 [Entamoeba invadens IP1]|eukprot:XP_004260012.1 hypothetical protein EIN_055960 [Entamoeba invadens IP1]
MEIEKEGSDKTQQKELLENGRNCFIEILKSYRKIIRTVKEDEHEDNKYPHVSAFKVQTEISRITHSFEQIQIVLNETMQQFVLIQNAGRDDRIEHHQNVLKDSQRSLDLFLTQLELLTDQGESLIAECESALLPPTK